MWLDGRALWRQCGSEVMRLCGSGWNYYGRKYLELQCWVEVTGWKLRGGRDSAEAVLKRRSDQCDQLKIMVLYQENSWMR